MLSENKLIYLGEACRMVFNSKEDNPYTNTMAETVWKLAHDSCLSCIEACAVVDAVEVGHGRWAFIGEECCICSACHKHAIVDYYYCPNCGAKMDLE